MARPGGQNQSHAARRADSHDGRSAFGIFGSSLRTRPHHKLLMLGTAMSSEDRLTNDERQRFDAEWMLINAIREAMSIAQRDVERIKYRQAITFATQVAPSIFATARRIIDNPPETQNARLFREKAAAQSRLTGQ